MNIDLHDQITGSLRRKADTVEVTRPLVAETHRQLHRQRTRRIVLAAAVAVVLAAGGVSVAIGLGGDDRDVVAGPPQVTFNLGDLPQGAPPQVPWSAGGVIHDGQHETSVESEGAGPARFVPVSDGYLIGGKGLIGTDGTTKAPLPVDGMPVISADRDTLAWMETVSADQTGGSEAELTTVDTASGEIQHQTTVGIRGTPVGFLGERVLLQDLDEQAQLWDPATGGVSAVPNQETPRFTNGRDLVAVFEEQDAGKRCTTVLDATRDFTPSWTRCDQLLESFSQDGKYALLHSTENEGNSYVLDAQTGSEVLRFRDLTVTGLTTEPSGDFLLEVTDAGQTGIVRCNLDGDCERTTELTSPSTAATPTLPHWW